LLCLFCVCVCGGYHFSESSHNIRHYIPPFHPWWEQPRSSPFKSPSQAKHVSNQRRRPCDPCGWQRGSII
jgi:hypothetical protein